jgi:hypothetical protein
MRFHFRAKSLWTFVLLGIAMPVLLLQQTALAQEGTSTGEWSRPLPVSGAIPGSWYPSIAATDDGILSVIWTSTQNNQDTIYLTQKDAVAWSRPIDVLFGGRHADLRVDGRNLLHLVFGIGDGVFVSDAPVDAATAITSWNQPFKLSRQPAFAGDFQTTPDGILHTVWTEKDAEGKHSLVIYNQSNDSAFSWNLYRVVGENALENTRARLAHGADGTLYVMWSAANAKSGTNGIEINLSANNGDSWLDTPRALGLQDADIHQPALALDKNNALVLVYNFGVKDETFFQVSTDQGVSWSEQSVIPGLFAASPATGNDYFAVANDSAGNVHLIAVGRKSKDQTSPGVYHVSWDGAKWSPPQELYQQGNFIEFPDLNVSNGNRLHVVFSTRARNQLSGVPDASSQIWYTEAETNAPAATRVPIATLTPRPTETSTPEPSATATRRPTPTRVPIDIGADTAPPPAANPLMPIMVGIVPVVAILAIAIIIVRVLRLRR